MNLRRCCAWLVALAVAATISLYAQDDLNPSYRLPQSAGLSVTFDKQGNADVRLNLSRAPQSWAPLQAALVDGLHCPADQFSRPATSKNTYSFLPGGRTAEQRRAYERAMSDVQGGSLQGHCSHALRRSGYQFSGDFNLGTFSDELSKQGASELWVRVYSPHIGRFEYSRNGLDYLPRSRSRYLSYHIPLQYASAPDGFDLHIAYGLSRDDLYNAATIAVAFVFLPVLIVLWMQRAALRLAKTDPTAAWFSFFRALNWCGTGAMLLWITSGLGARQDLQDWISLAGVTGWKAAAAEVCITLGPAFLAYFLCLTLSYPVFTRVRGTDWTRGEFLAHQGVTVAAQALPLMLFLTALNLISSNLNLSLGLFASAYFSFFLFRALKLRITKTFPQPVSTGELRDRVFALAARAGVKINRIFVLPAGKGQVANAYAAQTGTVIFTDYLLSNLSKREVDAIAAHEIGHLQHSHPKKRGIAFLAALFLPTYFPPLFAILISMLPDLAGTMGTSGSIWTMRAYAAFNYFDQWSQRDFLLILLGLTGFYFLSRRFENVADATALKLTGDPQAQITGLLKVSRLNFMPIQWSKTTERWLTHPSTARRAERIAKIGNLPVDQLHQLLAVQANTSGTADPLDHYEVRAAKDPAAVRSALREGHNRQLRVWSLWLLHVAPPACVAWIAQTQNWNRAILALAYIAGFVGTVVLYRLYSSWLLVAGRAAKRRRVMARLAEDAPELKSTGIFVGFAPAACPRFYGTRYYNWDEGFLVLSQDRLSFIGEQTRFSLSREQIAGMQLGPGSPRWRPIPRIYIHWCHPDTQTLFAFNLLPLEPCAMGRVGEQVQSVYQQLREWQAQANKLPAATEALRSLPIPSTAEVTCIPVQKIGRIDRQFKLVLVQLCPLILAVSVWLRLEAWWYLAVVGLALRLLELIPYWRYSDQPLQIPGRPSEKTLATAAPQEN